MEFGRQRTMLSQQMFSAMFRVPTVYHFKKMQECKEDQNAVGMVHWLVSIGLPQIAPQLMDLTYHTYKKKKKERNIKVFARLENSS